MNILSGVLVLLIVVLLYLAVSYLYKNRGSGFGCAGSCAGCAAAGTCGKKKHRYQAVVFDLDGTLLNTLGGLENAVNHVLQEAGYPARTRDEVRRFVGNGIHKLMERAVPAGTSPEETEKVFQAFKAYYTAHCFEKTEPYPGIEKMLAKLKEQHYNIAIASNKNDAAVQKLAQRFFPGVVDFTLGQTDGIPRKPEPQMMQKVMGQFQLSADQLLYVGDSEVDLQFAKNAGVDVVLVGWGFKGREFLEQYHPDRIIDRAEELLPVLEQNT